MTHIQSVCDNKDKLNIIQKTEQAIKKKKKQRTKILTDYCDEKKFRN